MSKKKIGKIVFASAVAVEGLQPYVEELLECLSRHLNQPGIAHALVSDESKVSDFLIMTLTKESRPHPLDASKKIQCGTPDTSENREMVEKAAIDLGINLGIRDYIYEAAIKLRDK